MLIYKQQQLVSLTDWRMTNSNSSEALQIMCVLIHVKIVNFQVLHTFSLCFQN